MSLKILLVDHDKSSADRIGGALRGAGHQLFTEIDTARALESFERMRPDIALVSDGQPGMPGAALCMRLKKTPTGSRTPVVFMTTKLPQGQEELSRRLEILGCDRIIDQRTSGEQLLDVCRQLVRSPRNEAAASATKGQATTQELPRVRKDTNRDAPSAVSFDDAMRSAFTEVGSPSDGRDIEAHLDSLFSTGHPVQPATPATPPAPAVRPAAGGNEVKAKIPAPVHTTSAAPSAAPTAPKPAAARPAQPRPVVARTPSVPKPAPVPPASRPAVTQKPAEPVRPTARHAPKAVEQLRLPRVPEVSANEGSAARRRLWPVVGLIGTTAILGALAVGYLVFFRGDAEVEGTPQPAESSVVEPPTTTAPPATTVPVEGTVATENLPEPPPLDEAAANEPVAANEPAPARVASATPAPQPKREPAPAATAEAATPPASKGPAAEPRRESSAARAGERPEPAPVPEPAKPSAETAAPEPRPSAQPDSRRSTTPAEQARPSEAEQAVAPEPAIAPPEVVNRVAPTYSAKALEGLDHPVIALRVLVDQHGKIARVVVEHGLPGSELEAAAISAVLRWTFRPATRDGVPVKAWTTVRFEFQE